LRGKKKKGKEGRCWIKENNAQCSRSLTIFSGVRGEKKGKKDFGRPRKTFLQTEKGKKKKLLRLEKKVIAPAKKGRILRGKKKAWTRGEKSRWDKKKKLFIGALLGRKRS